MRKQKLVLMLVIVYLCFANFSYALDNWVNVSNPSSTAQLQKIYKFSDNVFYVKTNANHFLKSTNAGINWTIQTLLFNPYSPAFYEFASENTIFYTPEVPSNSGILLRSTNLGANWDTLLKAVSFNTYFSTPIFINSQLGFVKQLYWGQSPGFTASEYLLRTTNGGVNWDTSARFTYFVSSIGGNGTHTYFKDFKVDAVSGVGFATYQLQGSGSSGAGYTSHVMKTTNMGTSWFNVSPDVSGQYTYISYSDTSRVYFQGPSSHLKNRGQQFPTDALSTRAGLFYFKSANEGFNFDGINLSYTNDTAQTWVTANFGSVINYMKFFDADLGFAFTDDNKIFRSSDGGVISSVNQISGNVPEQFSLKQNYPNPFNPSTRINYELRNANYVTMKVFNSNGKEVASLVNENQSAGSYAVDFNTSEYNLPSGIYFYTLNAGEFTETRKMILIK